MSKAPKAAPRKLKVFVTSTGFHDAYVAAPSRRAALAAWGSSHDLFARGVAAEVTDPALMEEPLAHPGEVVKRARGTREEQLAALGPAPKAKPAPKKAAKPAPPEPPRPKPPSDAEVKAAAEALREGEDKARRDRDAIARERAALDQREEALRRDLERLKQALQEAEADLTDRRRRFEKDLGAYEATSAKSSPRA